MYVYLDIFFIQRYNWSQFVLWIQDFESFILFPNYEVIQQLFVLEPVCIYSSYCLHINIQSIFNLFWCMVWRMNPVSFFTFYFFCMANLLFKTIYSKFYLPPLIWNAAIIRCKVFICTLVFVWIYFFYWFSV